MRFLLFREAPERHVLLLVASQLVLDPWSLDLLWRELRRAYQARHLDRDMPSSRRARFMAESGSRHFEQAPAPSPASVAYWQRELDGMPAALDLGADHPRPRTPSFR
ncbi:MAG TPA: hypothetical protein VM686_19975, partial [Polyangiaceae bacterium]|nr:hypothetical protein [Polyangiaceae bacterium]